MHPLTANLPYLTAELPGVGGTIKRRWEDFLVEELPLYEPTGTGEHLMLFVEKRGQTTSDIVRRLAKAFRVKRSDIGYAGLKDKHAVTSQHLTVHLPDPRHDEELLSRIAFTPIKLLWSRRHANKLRRGHHAGNRFVIRIRDLGAEALPGARRVLDELVRRGAPNFIGEQRFGSRQTNHTLGVHLLKERYQELLDLMLGGAREDDPPRMQPLRQAYDRGDYAAALEGWPRFLRHDRQALDAIRRGRSPRDAVFAIDPTQREFLVSSVQSAMFNHVVEQRLRAGALSKLLPGDLAFKHDNRSVFAVDQATADLENLPGGRVDQLEVSPSGPMWGPEMLQPTGEPLGWELEALSAFGLELEDLGRPPHVACASRRSVRMVVRQPDLSAGADEHGPFLQVSFVLDRGCFATVVLREIMKTDAADPLAQAGGES